MTNGFFNHDNPEARRTLARAESINATFQSVAEGFDKLPAEAEMKQGRVNRATVTGGPTAYVATLPYAPASYVDGLRFSFKVPSTNTGACTINVNGPSGALGIKSIKRFNGADPAPNDLTTGAIADVEYDGSVFVIVGAHGASETNAAASATAAAASQSAAAASASAAAGSASASASSASAAAASQSAAAGSATAAAGSASSAAGSATSAADSATAADQYASAAGGAAPAARMNWDTGTSVADPGAGKVRVNSATVASITAIHISESDAAAANLSAVFTSWSASSNPVKGRLRISHRLNLTKWIEADVTAAVDNGSWWTISVAAPTGPGGFAAADVVAVGFSRAGDKGVTSTYWGGTAGGTANALTATTGSNLSSLTAGQILGVKTGAAANSSATTLAVDSVPATAIRKNGSATVGGDLPANSDLWFQYDGTYLRLLGGSGSSPVSFPSTGQKTTTYTVTAADAGKLIPCSGSWTLSLPSAASAGNGFAVAIKNNGVGSISIAPNGSDTIDSALSGVLALNGSVILIGDGTKWTSICGVGFSASGATWSPTAKSTTATLSNGNLTVAFATSSQWRTTRAGSSIPSGKYYWEVRCDSGSGSNLTVGIVDSTFSNYETQPASPAFYRSSGDKQQNTGGTTAYGSAWTSGDVIGVAVDVVGGSIWFRKNGVWQASGDPAAGANAAYTGLTGTLYPACGTFDNAVYTARFKATDLGYSIPSGFSTIP
ncbi:SPRY domain-containing protein [Azospirillum palustre]